MSEAKRDPVHRDLKSRNLSFHSGELSGALRVKGYLVGDLRSAWRRLYHDLQTEVAVFICTGVILALFLYVFRYFLGVKLTSLDPNVARTASSGFAVLILLGTTMVVGGSRLRDRRDLQSLAACLRRIGETDVSLRIYSGARAMIQVIGAYGAAWFVVYRWFIDWSFQTSVAVQGGLLCILLLMMRWQKNKPESLAMKAPIFTVESMKLSRSETIYRWRFRQIIGRNRHSRAALIAACILSLAVLIAGAAGMPLFIGAAVTIPASLFVAITMPFQLVDDLKYSWAEQGMGVSHADIASAYQKIGGVLALVSGVVAWATFSGGQWLSGYPFDLSGLKLLGIGAVCPALMPGILFQIDPRRPVIQVLIVLIAGLFIGTAILAHWLGVILIPLTAIWAQRYQADRFYRA